MLCDHMLRSAHVLLRGRGGGGLVVFWRPMPSEDPLETQLEAAGESGIALFVPTHIRGLHARCVHLRGDRYIKRGELDLDVGGSSSLL